MCSVWKPMVDSCVKVRAILFSVTLQLQQMPCVCEPQRAQNVLSVDAAEFTPRREMRQAARMPEDALLHLQMTRTIKKL